MFFRTVIFVLSLLLLFACSQDSSTEPGSNNSVSGTVKFLDGSPAANAQIRLNIVAGNQSKLTNTDENGFYKFEGLSNSTYAVSFISQTYTINSHRTGDFELNNNSVTKDIFVTYNMLDEQKVLVVNDSLFFVMFQPEGARIGNNYNAVEYMTGYYRDNSNSSTLDSDIYEIPNNLDWQNPGTELTSEYIRNNFNFVCSFNDTLLNLVHAAFLTGENIKNILSDPGNGFAFVRKDNTGKRLQVPCVDFNNNDFGFQISYSEEYR